MIKNKSLNKSVKSSKRDDKHNNDRESEDEANKSNKTNKTNKSNKTLSHIKKLTIPKELLVKKEIVVRPIDKRIEVSPEKKEMISRWYEYEYMKVLNFTPAKQISEEMKSIAWRFSGLIRSTVSKVLKYSLTINTMDTIVIVFKLFDYHSKLETNYGFIFAEISETSRNPVQFKYYSAGPSFISCDGEYRGAFCSCHLLSHVLETYKPLWDELDTYLRRVKVRRDWTLYTNYFYPTVEYEKKSEVVEYHLRNGQHNMNILIIAWFHEVYNYMNKLIPIHTNEKYKQIFHKHMDDDVEFLKDIIRKYTSKTVEEFRTYTSHIYSRNKHPPSLVKTGHKMIPLNVSEVQNPVKLKFKPWREYLISQKTADLVINGITPGFSLFGEWFYVKNSRKGLFDNTSQYDRMKQSEIAREILHVLYEAQRGTYISSLQIDNRNNIDGKPEESSKSGKTSKSSKSKSKSKGDKGNKKDKDEASDDSDDSGEASDDDMQQAKKGEKQSKQWISNKFRKLNERIEDSIEYCQEDIIMSEVSLGLISEYVGRTIADVINLSHNSPTYHGYLGNPFSDGGIDYFSKYMFEFCYNLYCLNTKLGVIHGDLHLNNATIHTLYYKNYQDVSALNQPQVLYVLGNNDEYQYLFPTTGYFLCIIDFSRSIIHVDNYDLFQDKSLPSSFNVVDDVEEFQAKETTNLLNLYIQMFPNKSKKKEELLVLLKNHYDAVFKLLSCIDCYMFSIRLLRTLRQDNLKISDKAIDLVEKINKMAEFYITTEMNNLIEEPEEYSTKIISGEHPLLHIMKTCFQAYQIPNTHVGTITDIYVSKTELKYSSAKFSSYPPYIARVGMMKDGKPVDLTNELQAATVKMRMAYEEQKKQNINMMNYIAKRHKEKLF